MICCFKEINFDQCFNETFYTKLHGLLNVSLLFKSHYKAGDFLYDYFYIASYDYCCALMIYICLKNSWVSGDANTSLTLAVFIIAH